MSRLALLLLAAALALPLRAAAQTPASPAAAPAPAATPALSATDTWLLTLSAVLAERYHAAGDLRLSLVRPLPAAASADADLEILTAPAELAPQLLINVRARDAAGRTSDHTLVLRAELWQQGWTLRNPAPAGTPLNFADLEPRLHDSLRERDSLRCAADAAPEFDFARTVPAGRLLVWRDVARRPLVRRGQAVDVVASDGALTVSLRAVALHDAARGDPVRVRNPDSRREFVAIVTDDSRASVRF